MPPLSNSVAILSFSPIRRDARVQRQIEYLSREYPVCVAGYGELPPHLAARARMAPVEPPTGTGLGRKLRSALYQPAGRLASQAYEAWYWSRPDHRQALQALQQFNARVIHANDWDALPAAVKAAGATGAQVVLDLHEYSPGQFTGWRRQLFFVPMIDYFLRRYASRAAATVTVCEMIAEKYQQVYGFRPTVVMNAPEIRAAVDFRATDPGQVRLVHHGVAHPERSLELLIHTVAAADRRYTLHLMLIEAASGYINSLRTLAQQAAPGRVFFPDPVPTGEISTAIARYDMGFLLLPGTSFNNQAALPNKFFDFIAAGLAVCTGPNREMARLVDQHGFGVVIPSYVPEQAARVLNGLAAAGIDRMKRAALTARQELNADVEMGKLLALYHKLVDRNEHA